MKGTTFQLKVWKYLKKIPRGSVKTYIQVAKGIGKPLAVRAVANAIGKNPYAPRIPCHRVIRSDGSLGGYSGKGGIKTKKLLLKKEGVTLKNCYLTVVLVLVPNNLTDFLYFSAQLYYNIDNQKNLAI